MTRQLRRQGISVLVFLVSHWIWAEREEQYVQNLVSRYISEHMKVHQNKVPERPPSYSNRWPGTFQ